ncbi:MAG: 50S ribosomal protein L11 methyltransferase [Halobacteriovoraceae bacterium]|nr:50S ribosomal protein L11 methyltransferase [Halobacteriovoraceae bacterium]
MFYVGRMESSHYFQVDLTGQLSTDISSIAMKNFRCDGICEADFDEEKVDSLLGEHSYCGGEIPAEMLEKLENGASVAVTSFFFTEEEQAERFQNFVNEYFPDQIPTLKSSKNEDWNSEWKKYFHPVSLLGGKIVITPPWEFQGTDKEIIIDPGQGFGTGTHESTQLCLELLLEDVGEFSEFMDFGCGSGILGIAAILKKNVPGIFYDIDEGALENCFHNFEINPFVSKVSTKILSKKEGAYFSKNYPLVFANILKNVLISESHCLNQIASKYLIVSGITEEQVEDILAEFCNKHGFKLNKKRTRNNWVALLFEK